MPDNIKPSALSKQLSQITNAKTQAIKEGKIPDEQAVSKKLKEDENAYIGHDIEHPFKLASEFENFEDYMPSNTVRGGNFTLDQLVAQRAENAGFLTETGKAFGQLAVNIVPQIIGGVASMLDVPGYFSAEEAANNDIVRWADSVKKWSKEEMPLYLENPNKPMDFGDYSWWLDRGEGLVESVGSFVAQGAMLGGALKYVSGAAKLAKTASGAAKIVRAGEVAKTGLTSVMLNQSEAVIEATGVYDQTKAYWLDKGYSIDEAKKKAAIAASTTMNINRANILLNLTSAHGFLTPSKLTRQLITAPTKLGTIGKLIGEGAQEALEEGINHIGSQAGLAAGKGESYSYNKAMKDLGSAEGLEAMLLGAVGGIAQTGGGHVLDSIKIGPKSVVDENGNRISANEDLKNRYQKQQEQIEEMKKTGVKFSSLFDNIQKVQDITEKNKDAAERGNNEEIDKNNHDLFLNGAYKSFQTGTAEIYEQTIKDSAEQLGLDAETTQNAIAHFKELEHIYNNVEGYANKENIFTATAENLFYKKQYEKQNIIHTNNQTKLSNEINRISNRFKFKKESDILFKKEGQVVGSEKVTKEVPITYDSSNLEENTGDTEENKNIYNDFLNEVKKTEAWEKYQNSKEELEKADNFLTVNNDGLSHLKSKEGQEEALKKSAEQKRNKEILDRVNAKDATISELEKIKNEVTNPIVKATLEAKLKTLKEQKATEELTKKHDIISKDLQDKIVKSDLKNIDSIEKNIEQSNLPQQRKNELFDMLNIKKEELKNNIGSNNSALSGSSITSGQKKSVKLSDAEVNAKIPTNYVPVNKNNIIEEVENVLSDLLKRRSPGSRDAKGNVIWDYNKTDVGHNKAAHLSRNFVQVDSTGHVTREEIENSINEKGKHLLRSNVATPGTKIVFKVEHNYDGDVYSTESTTKEKKKWSDRKNEIKNDSTKYNAEVPIAAYTEDGQFLFYIHELNWINNENVDNSSEELEFDRLKMMSIRNKIVNSEKEGKQITTTIQNKSTGILFKTKDNKTISLDEAMPDENLIIHVGDKDGTIKGYEGNKKIINPDNKVSGATYALVPIGENLAAIRLEQTKVTQEITNTIFRAVECYLDPNSDENAKLIEEIANTGYDISDIKGLSAFINNFIYLIPTETNLKDLVSDATTEWNSKNHLVSVTGNSIEFGRPGITPDGKNSVISIFKGSKTNRQNLEKFKKHLEGCLVHFKNEAYSSGADVAIVNADGSVTTSPYKSFVKGHFKTNVLSANVGTESKPEWTYTIQPSITYDTTFVPVENNESSNVSNIEKAKKAEIERINKEWKDAIEEYDRTDKDAILLSQGFNSKNKKEAQAHKEAFQRSREKREKIDAKYYAKLDALEASFSDIEAQKADIERRRQVELDKALEVEGKGLVKASKTTGKGVEKLDKVGTIYNQGDKVTAEVIPTADGYKSGEVDVIVKQEEPQINVDGIMAQSAKIVVMQFSSLEEGLRYIAENPIKVNPKRIDRINAKYDAELAALKNAERFQQSFGDFTIFEGLDGTYDVVDNSENGEGVIANYVKTKEEAINIAQKADIERKRQEELDNLFSQTQSSTDKQLNTPVQKLSKEQVNKNIEEVKQQNKDLIEELENPEFLNDKNRNDEWDKKADELSDKLPQGVSFRITNGKVDLFDNQSYRESNFGGNRITQVSVFNLHKQTEKFEVGDTLQVNDGARAIPATVTKVNENGKVLEAKQNDGRIIISKGNIVTLAPINDRLKINAEYDRQIAALGQNTNVVKTQKTELQKIEQVKDVVINGEKYSYYPLAANNTSVLIANQDSILISDMYDNISELKVSNESIKENDIKPGSIFYMTVEKGVPRIVSIEESLPELGNENGLRTYSMRITSYDAGGSKEIESGIGDLGKIKSFESSVGRNNLSKKELASELNRLGVKKLKVKQGLILPIVPSLINYGNFDEDTTVELPNDLNINSNITFKSSNVFQKTFKSIATAIVASKLQFTKPGRFITKNGNLTKEGKEILSKLTDSTLPKNLKDLDNLISDNLDKSLWEKQKENTINSIVLDAVTQNKKIAQSLLSTGKVKFNSEYSNAFVATRETIRVKNKENVQKTFNNNIPSLQELNSPSLGQTTSLQEQVEKNIQSKNIDADAKKIADNIIDYPIQTLTTLATQQLVLPTEEQINEQKLYKRALEIRSENQESDKPKTKRTKFRPNISRDVDDFVDMDVTASESLKEAESKLKISGLSISQQDTLIKYIASNIVQKSVENEKKTGSKDFNYSHIFEEHKQEIEDIIADYEEDGYIEQAEKLKNVLKEYEKLKGFVNDYLSLMTTGKVRQVKNKTENEDVNDEALSTGLENVLHTDDWSLTMDSKSTASADLKKFFSFIKDVDLINGEYVEKTNSLGFPEVVLFDTVYNTLHEILADLPADYDQMLTQLEAYKNQFPWIENVIEQLENGSKHIKNEFVSDMAKHGIKMRSIIWQKTKDGSFEMTSYDANSSSTQQRLLNVWESNLRSTLNTSRLVITNNDGDYIYNQESVDILLEQAKNWKENPPSKNSKDDDAAVMNWLNSLGIFISNQTFNALKKGTYKNKSILSYEGLFNKSNGLINVLASELKNKRNTKVDESRLLKDTVVKNLAMIEALYATNVYSNSFNAGGKTVYTFSNNKWVVNRFRDLGRTDENGEPLNKDLIEGLEKIAFTRDSLWLEQLKNNPEFRNHFGLDYLSLEAIKKKFTPSKDGMKLNNLSDAEHEAIKLALFMNAAKPGEEGRKVSFFYPTNSDKTTMMVMNALSQKFELDKNFNFNADSLTLNENEEAVLSDETLDTLYKAIVLPEIARIRANKENNIAGYNGNAFFFLKSLNVVEYEGKTILDHVIEGTDVLSDEKLDEIIKSELSVMFNELLRRKLENWNESGIGKTNNDTKEKNTFLDSKYMQGKIKGVKYARVKFAAADFIFNSLIANAEAIKLVVGDPALYWKEAKGKNVTILDHIRETEINMGKRLAGDIAPGIELANASKNNYYQVFIDDKKVGSKGLLFENNKAKLKSILDPEVFAKYEKGIEGADAQEYTTWKEHLYVLKQLGRLTEKQYTKMYNLLQDGKSLENADLKLVLQPMKPVYVGNMLDIDQQVDRRIYIKSSSFPLLPQLTSGFGLDTLRNALEDFEKRMSSKNSSNLDGTKVTVRASFNTANKVGAIKNSLKVYNKEGKFNDVIEINEENSLKLSRENFRIQQDVPYDPNKEKINVGTQERKLLFNNILDMEGFKMFGDDKQYKGSEIKQIYDNAYKDIFEHSVNKLKSQLGLSEYSIDASVDSLLEIPDTNTFDVLDKMNKELETVKGSQIKKEQVKAKYEEIVNKKDIERADYINKHFDEIITKFAEAKINIFFNEDGETKKCN